jgi:uncharacterized protein
MQYIVTAYDGTDEKVDDEGKRIGSVMVVDFPSREEQDKWLKVEPYVVAENRNTTLQSVTYIYETL